MKKQLFILLLLVSGNVLAQRAAVKTNLLHDAATAPSLAAEWAFASRWTLDVAGSACPWNFADNRKWKFWMTQGEARYWLCQSFYGPLSGCACRWGRIQPEPGASSFCFPFGFLPLRGVGADGGVFIRLLVGARQTLESGGYHRCRVGACPIQTF